VVYWGVYAGIRRIPTSGGFLTAYTHLSDHKYARYLQALCHAHLRIPTSIFSNTPLAKPILQFHCYTLGLGRGAEPLWPCLAVCLSVCLSTSISPELHARPNFYACYLYSGVRTIHYFVHFFSASMCVLCYVLFCYGRPATMG